MKGFMTWLELNYGCSIVDLTVLEGFEFLGEYLDEQDDEMFNEYWTKNVTG